MFQWGCHHGTCRVKRMGKCSGMPVFNGDRRACSAYMNSMFHQAYAFNGDMSLGLAVTYEQSSTAVNGGRNQPQSSIPLHGTWRESRVWVKCSGSPPSNGDLSSTWQCGYVGCSQACILFDGDCLHGTWRVHNEQHVRAGKLGDRNQPMSSMTFHHGSGESHGYA